MNLTQDQKDRIDSLTTIEKHSFLGTPTDYNANGYRVETKRHTFLGGGAGLNTVRLFDGEKVVATRSDHKGYYSSGDDILAIYCALVLKRL